MLIPGGRGSALQATVAIEFVFGGVSPGRADRERRDVTFWL